ncbi:MAG: C39 family peptidase [Pseudomonadota bacterium]
MKLNKLRLMLFLALAMSLTQQTVRAIELGVASGMRMVVPLKTLKQVRFDATVRQQYDFSCGSAALATLLSHHYGVVVSEQEAFEQMFRNGDQAKIRQQGFSLLDMQRFLATRGFRADGFELPLEKLAESKLPAIVLVADKGYNHFVVIKGIAEGRVLLGDPSSGARSVPLDQFRQMWTSKLLFVIHGYKGEVAFNRSADWRVAPKAPLAEGLARASLDNISLPKFGPGDF